MYTELMKYKCGNCGGDMFRVFGIRKTENKLIVECINGKCKATSEIMVTEPKLKIDFGKDSNGMLAIF